MWKRSLIVTKPQRTVTRLWVPLSSVEHLSIFHLNVLVFRPATLLFSFVVQFHYSKHFPSCNKNSVPNSRQTKLAISWWTWWNLSMFGSGAGGGQNRNMKSNEGYWCSVSDGCENRQLFVYKFNISTSNVKYQCCVCSLFSAAPTGKEGYCRFNYSRAK